MLSEKNMPSRFKYLLLLSAIPLALFAHPAKAVTLTSQLSGRILLQVESKGEAWYVNPQDSKRYYLGRPDDAFSLMRLLSTGISEKEFASWNKGAPTWARGRLFIRPQSHGESYYVDLNSRWHYLGRPMDAWQLLRAQGLGITNSNLAKIPSASNQVVSGTTVGNTAVADHVTNFTWKYNLEDFKLALPMKSSLDLAYANSVKAFYYTGDVEPADAREQFYGMFFKPKSGDTTVKDLVAYGRKMGAERSWSQDQIAAFLLALVQYISYDNSKLNQDPLQPNYPYETLYKDSGICSDKTFLAVSILRELGYGAAILDFPDLKHSAAGISCPVSDSINGSGYCYVETTNYFPVGVVPPQISGGQAVINQDSLSDLFGISHLSKMEVFQKTAGTVYQGVSATKKIVADLQAEKTWIEAQKPLLSKTSSDLSAEQATLTSQQTQLNDYQASGNISAYNSLVAIYNAGVNKFNGELEAYRSQLAVYNGKVNEFNKGLSDFYQQ